MYTLEILLSGKWYLIKNEDGSPMTFVNETKATLYYFDLKLPRNTAFGVHAV